ncbi:GATA type transcriptional activator of nitrogen-regulated proteins [Coemansia sp. RSA 1822]|nr:GATA type transcriptional activator of nitrogen-regulated proteins [Coemansia sp. RSA 638]KAJ2124535.1 GATA type transcriptional activator of nitrogen-regulated proteins [Coemansia sp. RSA 720]KAJ2540136.1 GATA type transcriptional activator of nitrogen-regulated proteins [Coemansia sp. RSA 1853]KAJ2560333.1 GATA type transcriptional activator of nitrogen-regulated proteins [Coemansia sp. RSA 1822]KAJ2665211.1 GATA type transcriptional activator of nitrogen-regulated proteins [Coemansia sp. 
MSPEPKSTDQTVCFNCHVDTTPLWRRDTLGNVICNACGLYYKLHNIARPISMKRAVIKRRRRRATNSTSPKARTPLGRSTSLPLDELSEQSVPKCGLETLMRAAEMSPPMDSKRPQSLLDSLATVASAEISLNKRRALDFHCSGFSSFDAPHPAYREALQRECERLCMEAASLPMLNLK